LPQKNNSLSFAKLPEGVRKLLFFSKPDLVVCLDDGLRPVRAVFAVDATEHVAARDHWIQRFPNLVGCAQERVPGAFVVPADMPNRPNFRGKTDPFFFFTYDRVMEIHQTPIYIAEWVSSDGASLEGDSDFRDLPPHDSLGMRKLFEFFNRVLEAAMKGQELSSLMRERLIVELRQELRRVAYGSSIPSICDFDRLKVNMPENRPLETAELSRWLAGKGLSLPEDLPDRIAKRDRHIVFSPLTRVQDREKARKSLKDRIAAKGGDPYTQQPLVFDYLFCRLGPTPWERDANLVIDLSVLSFSDFAEYVKDVWARSPLRHTEFSEIKKEIPIYTLHLEERLSLVMKNFVRLYAFAADIIVFRDGLLYF
jgi:hypothetical protein